MRLIVSVAERDAVAQKLGRGTQLCSPAQPLCPPGRPSHLPDHPLQHPAELERLRQRQTCQPCLELQGRRGIRRRGGFRFRASQPRGNDAQRPNVNLYPACHLPILLGRHSSLPALRVLYQSRGKAAAAAAAAAAVAAAVASNLSDILPLQAVLCSTVAGCCARQLKPGQGRPGDGREGDCGSRLASTCVLHAPTLE